MEGDNRPIVHSVYFWEEKKLFQSSVGDISALQRTHRSPTERSQESSDSVPAAVGVVCRLQVGRRKAAKMKLI